MAFFEQLGKKLTDAGQGVAQQTKNFTEVTRLSGAISEKEKRVNQLLGSLGKAYYERHQNDPSAIEPEIIKELNTLNMEIIQCREEIKQIKGVVKCPRCGEEVSLNAAFCSVCGERIPQEPAVYENVGQGTQICPQCHSVVSAGNRFCNRCGAKMDKEEA